MDHEKNLPIVVYTPESQIRSPLKLLKSMVHDLIESRELAWRLAVRDIHAQYRQASLGILWAFFLPLANAVVWIFLNSSGILSIANYNALPYQVYVFTGTIIWAIFMEALNAPLQQVNSAKGMLAKLNFPREALVVSGIYQTLFNAAIKIMLLLCVLIFWGVNPGWGLLFFPCGILSLVLVGTAVGLMITPVGMLYTDVGRALPILMQFLMFVTPVVFPVPKAGWAATLFSINPLTPLVLTSRDWLTGFVPSCLGNFMLVNAVSLLVLLMVWVVYRLAMPILIERTSA